jgi:hypothetical protein
MHFVNVFHQLMVSILAKLVTTPWTKISNGCLGRRSGINQMLALLKGENGRVRGRVFSYARSSPACAIPDSSPKLEDPRKRPILLVTHSNNSAQLRTWSTVFWRVWSESGEWKCKLTN